LRKEESDLREDVVRPGHGEQATGKPQEEKTKRS
jgi:hypothetical protein